MNKERLTMRRSHRSLVVALAGLLWALTGFAGAADPTPSDPAARQIALFDNALLDTMKDAARLGVKGRFNRLKPAIEQSFDLAAMTAAAVGPNFKALPAAEQNALIEAFERMTAASYAHNFDGYHGESFTIDPNVAVRGDHKLVQTTLVAGSDRHAFNYVMHAAGGHWKAVDILLEGYVSQAATKRSDFAATLAGGGAKALVARLDAISDGLLAS